MRFFILTGLVLLTISNLSFYADAGSTINDTAFEAGIHYGRLQELGVTTDLCSEETYRLFMERAQVGIDTTGQNDWRGERLKVEDMFPKADHWGLVFGDVHDVEAEAKRIELNEQQRKIRLSVGLELGAIKRLLREVHIGMASGKKNDFKVLNLSARAVNFDELYGHNVMLTSKERFNGTPGAVRALLKGK